MSDMGLTKTAAVDAYLSEGDCLDCPACDGGVERDSEHKLTCDLCQREWTDVDLYNHNKRRLS